MFGRSRSRDRGTRIFVASDIHGSDVCFRKFINAARFYRVDVLVLGGDITGKALVPITRQEGGRFRLRFMGRDLEVGEDEVAEVERLIRFNGYYPYRCDPDEGAALLGDFSAVDEAFERAMRRQLEGWLEFAEERLARSGALCFVMPGNDDPGFVPELLAESRWVQNHDGTDFDVGGLRILGYGWSNPTPWETPRERPEDIIEKEVRELLERSGDPGTLIFNPHVPPYGTGLDLAPELRPDFTMVKRSGQPNMVPVGSRAVRQLVEEYQPLLVVTGHIHESRGVKRVGRSVCINPGSEYNVGRLLGAIVDVSAKGVRDVQLVAG